MAGSIGGNGAAIEAVVIVNGEITVGNGINHIVIYPAEVGAIGLPFDNGHRLHI